MAEPEVEPIVVYTTDAVMNGWIAPNGQRVTDMLNAMPALTLLVPDEDETRWTNVERDDICLVTPPPHTGNRQLRLHRQKHRVVIDVGPCEVTGTAHLIPGVALDLYLLRTRQRFLPVTAASIAFRDAPWEERTVDVAIVNVGNITAVQKLLTLA
jgi:hypothetical protein